MTAATPLDKEVSEQLQRLYLALLKKTTEHVENTPASDLKPSMVSAARSLLRDNGATRDEMERKQALEQARQGMDLDLPYFEDDTPNPNYRPDTQEKTEPAHVPFRDAEPAATTHSAIPKIGYGLNGR